MFASIFLIFFLLFSIQNPQILRLSRTAGVTMVTFTILEISLMSVYGGYAIGRQKSKPIVYNLVLATIITDIITNLQLSIMNTNENFNHRFEFADPELLLLSMILQIIVIIIFVYLGNFLYFKANPPENCIVITSSQDSLNKLVPKIKKYKKQYKITSIFDFKDKKIYDEILKNDTVFVYDVPVSKRSQIIEYCYENHKNIYYNLEMCDIVSIGSDYTLLDDKPLIMANIKELSFEQRFIKRLMDIILSSIAFIILSPVMLLCAVLIKCEDGGKIFFNQKRATKNGKIFYVYKFRTMKENSDKEKHVSATENDDRITKIGSVLRKFRIDELPQLVNILKGEMSIVGPRPEMLDNIDKYTKQLPEFSYRLRVKAGLTGLAQVFGKYNTSPKDKLVLDLMYIEKYSIWQDIKLIFQTLIVFFKSDSTEGFNEQTLMEFNSVDD